MDISTFSLEELPIALGAIRAVEPEPSAAQDHFLEVVAKLHRTTIDPFALPIPTMEETAQAITDPHRRKRLLQLAMVNTMIDGEVGTMGAANVNKLATTLGVDERGVSTLKRMAAHHDFMARFDMIRRVGGRIMKPAWEKEGVSGVAKILAAMNGRGVEDPDLARRFNRLGLLPEGTFGRALWHHNVSRDFGFPGQRGGIPLVAVFHDLGHILSGYDTDAPGEIQQGAFQAGFVRSDGFMFLFFAIAQFHLGLKITPVADPFRGLFDADKVFTALARGAACKIDLSDNWDFWPYLPRPLDEVRAELGIPA